MKSNHLYFALCALLSCSACSNLSFDTPTSQGEVPLSTVVLEGRWADRFRTEYIGGGDLVVSRKIEFKPGGNFSMSQHTVDRSSTITSETYSGFRGTYQIEGTSIVCSATEMRTKDGPFLSDAENWVPASATSGTLRGQAMIFDGKLYWNPRAPLWTETTSSEVGSTLTLVATVQDFQKAEERQTWTFYDTGASVQRIDQRTADGSWSNEIITIVMYSRIEGATLISDPVKSTGKSIPVLKSRHRYFFGTEGILQRE